MKAVLLLLLLIFVRHLKTTIQDYVVLKPSQYEFLKELYFNTGGPNWKNNENWDFTNYTTRNPCVQNWYGITAIGFADPSTCSIGTVYLDDNNLIGSLPNKIENFDELFAFSVYKNHLYGSLPTFINIPRLVLISFGLNSFTGSFPKDMIQGNKVKISSLRVNDNSLSGTLPDWISSLTSINYLYLQNNHFSGTLPNLANLTSLFTFAVQNNRLHGSLPSPLDIFHKIKAFQFDNNFFSGTIQSLIIGKRYGVLFSATENNLEGSLPKNYSNNLQSLLLTSNYLTGTIPEVICFRHLRFFSVSDNKLRGTIPSCLWRKFVTLELDFNLFHGPIVYSKDSLQSSLPAYLSFGFNHFSGTFPVDLLYLPSLTAISASNNCFLGGFNNLNCSLIASQNLRHFYFDGLFSPFSCSKSFMEGAFKSFRSYGGSFPSCLLSRSDWDSGYFSGNGFTGTLSADIFSSLQRGANFNITRNYLTGTLPQAVSNVIWSNFDVSFNKIHGSIPKFNLTNQEGPASLILSNNRFSQLMNFPILGSSSNFYRLEISKGNLLEKGMGGKNTTYPASMGVTIKHQLDEFILLDFCILLILVIISWKYIRPITNDADCSASFIFLFMVFLVLLLNFFLLPLNYFFHSSFHLGYKVFEKSSHWKLTSLYLHGFTPAAICLFVLFAINFLLLIVLTRRSTNRNPIRRFKGSNKSFRKQDQIIVASLYLFVFVLNVIISTSIHIFYIMFLNNRIADAKVFAIDLETEVLLMQMGLGLYHVLWNRYVLMYLLGYLGRTTDTMYLWWYYEYGLMLLLTNSVISPWLSMMLKDESCFESLISSHIEVNRVIGSIECLPTALQSLELKICHRHSSFLLPFMYYHQCGSKLLVSFLPVWVYYFAFITLINYFSTFCLLSFQCLFPGNIRRYLEIFLNDARSNHQLLEIDYLFDFSFLFICVVHCPLFGMILLGKGLSQFVLYKVGFIPPSNPLPAEIEMQIPQSTNISEEDDFALATSEHGLLEKGVNGDINEEPSYRHQDSQLRYSWQLLYIPALFNSVIIFDMVADEYSWRFGIGFVIGLFLVAGTFHMIVTFVNF